jgi:hypothetical protein
MNAVFDEVRSLQRRLDEIHRRRCECGHPFGLHVEDNRHCVSVLPATAYDTPPAHDDATVVCDCSGFRERQQEASDA